MRLYLTPISRGNRTAELIARLASIHFPPTAQARGQSAAVNGIDATIAIVCDTWQYRWSTLTRAGPISERLCAPAKI